jgi:hypothetical protein
MDARTIVGTVLMGAIIVVTIAVAPQIWGGKPPPGHKPNSQRIVRDPDYTHTTGGRKKYTRKVKR